METLDHQGVPALHVDSPSPQQSTQPPRNSARGCSSSGPRQAVARSTLSLLCPMEIASDEVIAVANGKEYLPQSDGVSLEETNEPAKIADRIAHLT